MSWEIILNADEDCQLAAVHLDAQPLDHTKQECGVPSLDGCLVVSCQYEQRYEVPLFEGGPLIFKLRKNWRGEGRKIARITNGHFILIAPATWERTGRAPVEPDACADTGFRVHYFYKNATATNESIGGFREWGNSPVATGIELAGRRVFDDSDAGDLFVGNAPILKSSSDVVWARVGEETELGWGLNFRPNEQSLAEVLDGREGRFFLRVYDSEAKLLDSTDFRYLRNLRQIRVNGTAYSEGLTVVPALSGHPPSEVRFVDADGSTIDPILQREASQVVEPSGVLLVPPNPDADRISCALATNTSRVDIVLELSRIWWRLEGGHSELGDWKDTPVIMTRQEFQRHAYSNVSMALLSRRFGSVRVGFNDELAQRYRRLTGDEQIAIPLVHFVDHAQIVQRLREDAHFNVEWAGKIVPLIVVSADPMPEILSFTAEPSTIFARQEVALKWTTRNARNALVSIDPVPEVVGSDGIVTVRPTKTTRYTLTLTVPGTDGICSTVEVAVKQQSMMGRRPIASVMSTGGGWRYGKGFSVSEIRAAGVTVKGAVQRSIPIDRRRRSLHRANVERIRSVRGG